MRWLALILATILAVLAAAGAWLWRDYRRTIDLPLATTEAFSFEIQKGETLKSVAGRLRQAQLLDKPWWLIAWAYQQRQQEKIKAGEYLIEPGSSLRDFLAMVVAGRVRQYKITFVEGWTVRQLLAAIQEHPAVDQTLQGVGLEQLLEALGLPAGHPEGRFFPDTYFFHKHTSDRDLLRRAYHKMAAVLAEEWQNRTPELPLKTPDQALILASIVEKETGAVDEQPRIAGVFLRRLKIGMRLQSDPTIIYGMGEAYDGDIRFRDLRRDTPYNTYVHGGLPPTPIALPGRNAIHAVLHPAPGNALYFVAQGNGRHIFSATLQEHNRAVSRYQNNSKR